MKPNIHDIKKSREISHLALREDPRLDPRIAEILAMAPESGVIPPDLNASYQSVLNYISEAETADAQQQELMALILPKIDSVTVTEATITGGDGNSISLYIHRPRNSKEVLPGVVHLHGGGMAMMSAADPGYKFLRSAMAQTGMVVIGVEFRNSAGRLGPFPFPAGLNDCEQTVHWVDANRESLGVGAVLLCGESGGGNLSLATALKAKRQGWLHKLDGVYASCPFISGDYANPPLELGSLVECDGYMLNQYMTNAMVRAYDPHHQFSNEALAWPLCASRLELSGLPPHVISVNELDPLRDEGLAYGERLQSAGVKTSIRTMKGTPHAGELLFNQVVPDLFAGTLESICRFASELEISSCGV